MADLVFRSVVKQHEYAEARFRPYSCHAAVLFVDLSGYSIITAALSNKGAHSISKVVNAYLARLLRIIGNFGGDVVKFAGDAVLAVWEHESPDELENNVEIAATCALNLQRQAGRHSLNEKLSFEIHCALACGMLESEVFGKPTSCKFIEPTN